MVIKLMSEFLFLPPNLSSYRNQNIIDSNMKFTSSFMGCFNPSTPKFIEETDYGYVKEEEVGVTNVPHPNFRVFSYDELRVATQGFKNKIGEGGFGTVYKGRLIGDRFIAVKVVSVEVESMRGEREFISEIAALSDIKHDNLVTLKGCCVDGAQRLLVYDYMENNSLAQTFLGTEQKRARFSWELRKGVALGVARGLWYLHEQVNPHIIHRDIKASNILVDADFTPKLADFGLAKLFTDNVSYISTRVAGTLGYLSPEYAYSGHLTRKSDVYSFGVLLLEIVSGRQVVEYHIQHGEQFLVDKAWELYNAKSLLMLVDSQLNGDFPEEEALRFLRVGLLCVQEIARLRPAMSTALKILKGEMSTEDVDISQPGLVSDLMEVKIRRRVSSNFTSSPASSSNSSFQVR